MCQLMSKIEENIFTESISCAAFYTVLFLVKWQEACGLSKYDGLCLLMPCCAEPWYFHSILQNH